MRDSDIANLVDTICAAGTDSTRWPILLERLQRVFDARIGALFVHHFGTQAGAFSFNRGLAPDHVRAYDDYYAARNVWMIHGRELNVPGNVRTSEERYPPGDLIKTEFYNDFLRRAGVAHGLGGTILRDGPQVANITLMRGGAAFGDQARRALSILMPHLRRAIRTHRRLAGFRLEEQAAVAALDHVPFGVLLLDAAARPLFVNAEGRRLAAARDGLWIDEGMVTAARPRETQTLRALVARAARRGGGGGSMALERPARRALGIDVTPLAPAEENTPSRIVALLVFDPEYMPESDERLLARLYGLSPAEAGLAARLAAGEPLPDAAAQRGIAHETARTHLRAILRKTGARRQAELVLRLAQGPLRMAASMARRRDR